MSPPSGSRDLAHAIEPDAITLGWHEGLGARPPPSNPTEVIHYTCEHRYCHLMPVDRSVLDQSWRTRTL